MSRFIRPLVVGLVLLAPARVIAQRCALPDTTGSWYQRQREWWQLDRARDWSDDPLRIRLLAAAGISPTESSFPAQLGAEIVGVSSSPGTAELSAIRDSLRAMARNRRWPTRAMVGSAGLHATWVIASGDSTLAGTAMHRLMEAGPGEGSPADVAVLEDRQRIRAGRKQLYASQLGTGLIPLPTEDSAHVDLRRDAAGLPPLARAVCALRSGRP